MDSVLSVLARNNLPAMMGKMVTDPARTFAVEKLREAWNKQNDAEEDENQLAPYKREQEPWYAGKNQGGSNIWVPGGRYNPEMDINRLGLLRWR